MGQDIPGWDQALLLPKGSKATLPVFSPLALAYGAQGLGPDIPANAPLCFDLEV